MSNPESPNNQPNQEPSTSEATYGRPPSPSQPLPQPQQPQWQQQPPLAYPQYGSPSYPLYPPSQPLQPPRMASARNQLPLVLIGVLAVIILVGASIFGTLAVSGALASGGSPIMNGAQISATSTALAGSIQATATANAIQTSAMNPLAGTQILTSIQCTSRGSGCNGYTSPQFTATGPFDILWDCQNDYTSSGNPPGGSLQFVLSNGSGQQVDALTEPALDRRRPTESSRRTAPPASTPSPCSRPQARAGTLACCNQRHNMECEPNCSGSWSDIGVFYGSAPLSRSMGGASFCPQAR